MGIYYLKGSGSAPLWGQAVRNPQREIYSVSQNFALWIYYSSSAQRGAEGVCYRGMWPCPLDLCLCGSTGQFLHPLGGGTVVTEGAVTPCLQSWLQWDLLALYSLGRRISSLEEHPSAKPFYLGFAVCRRKIDSFALELLCIICFLYIAGTEQGCKPYFAELSFNQFHIVKWNIILSKIHSAP